VISGRIQSITARHRRELVVDLLYGRRAKIPATWLTRAQQKFLARDANSTAHANANAKARDLVDRVARLCDELVPRLIDDFVASAPPTVRADAERIGLHRRGGPTAVCRAIFGNCGSWPASDPARLAEPARAAVHEALRATLTRRLARRPYSADAVARVNGAAGADIVLRPDRNPVDDRDLVDRQTTRATSSDDMVSRYMRLEMSRDLRALLKTLLWVAAGVATVVPLSAVYVVLFLVLRHHAPDLTVEQDMMVAWVALGGGAGLGLIGQTVKTRIGRRRPGGEPLA
jgi:hypothetical protein